MSKNVDNMPKGIIYPRQLFGHDLKELTESKILDGHQLIINGIFNSEYEELSEWMIKKWHKTSCSAKRWKNAHTHGRNLKILKLIVSLSVAPYT